MRHWIRRLGGALAVVLVASLVGTGAVGAQEAPPAEVPPSDPQAQAAAVGVLLQAVTAAAELTRLSARLAEVDRRLADVRARLAATELALVEIEQQLDAARAERQIAIDRLHARAADSYRLGGAPLDPVLDLDRHESFTTVMKYAAAAAAVDNDEVERLDARVKELAEQQQAQVQQQRDLTAAVGEVTTERVGLADQVLVQELILQSVGGVTVMGESALTAAQMTAWFESRGQRANLPDGTTIGDLAQMFIEEGAAEHVRADVAFVQSVLETGFFRETRGNNYAGIGNCDSCGGRGMFFPTPRDGVRAQIQLLRNYADTGSRASNLAFPPDVTLYGADPARAAVRYDTFFLKGNVPLWNQMGNGNWATSTTYAAKVLGLYAQMLEFSAK